MDFNERIEPMLKNADVAKEYGRNLMKQIENELLDVRLSTQCLQDGIPIVSNDPNEALQLSASRLKTSQPSLTQEIAKQPEYSRDKANQFPDGIEADFAKIPPPTVDQAPFYSYLNAQRHHMLINSNISVKSGLSFQSCKEIGALEESQIKCAVSYLNGRENKQFQVFSSPKCRKSAKIEAEGYGKIGLSMNE